MNQYLPLNVILAAWQYAFCHFEKKWKCRVAVLFQNSIMSISLFSICFEGGVYVGLLDDRSQNAHKVFYLRKVTVTDQILHTTVFIKIAEHKEEEQIAVKSEPAHIIHSSIVLSA